MKIVGSCYIDVRFIDLKIMFWFDVLLLKKYMLMLFVFLCLVVSVVLYMSGLFVLMILFVLSIFIDRLVICIELFLLW